MKLAMTGLIGMFLVSSAAFACGYSHGHSGYGKGCRPTYEGELGGKCIQTLVENGYSMKYGNRASICSQTETWFAIEALGGVASTRKSLPDSALASIVRYSTRESADCAKAFAENNYDISYGNRAAICGYSMTRDGVMAVRAATRTGKSVPDSTLVSLTRIESRAALRCVEAFTENGYDISYGNRAAICGQTEGEFAADAIYAATSSKKSIPDSALASLTRISNPHAAACVKSFTRNGYEISYGNRAAICSQFCSPTQVRALDALTSARQSVPDSTLASLANLR